MSEPRLNPEAQSLLDAYLDERKAASRRRSIQAILLFAFLNVSAFFTVFELLKRSYDDRMSNIDAKISELDTVRQNAVQRLNEAEGSIEGLIADVSATNVRLVEARSVAEQAGGMLDDIRSTIGLDDPDQEERLQRLAELLAVVGPNEKLDLLRQIRDLEGAVEVLRLGRFDSIVCRDVLIEGGTLRIANAAGGEAVRLGVEEDGSGSLRAHFADGSTLATLGVSNQVAAAFSLYCRDGDPEAGNGPRLTLSARKKQGQLNTLSRAGESLAKWPSD